MPTPIDPTSLAFLYAENRRMPMHVGGLQLFEKPAGAPEDYTAQMYEQMRSEEHIRPLFLRHPHRGVRTGGQYVWREDEQFDIDHHVRHSALPRPGRIRELLDLCSRLHGTRLARERPLWESHVIEGLADDRVALYTKIHHSLVDGIAAIRLMQSSMSTDPDESGMPAPWAIREGGSGGSGGSGRGSDVVRRDAGGLDLAHLAEIPISTLRTALGLSAEAAGMPGALLRTLTKSVRNETSAVSLHAPHTMFNTDITGARRFAAQDWEMDRLHAIGKASGTTLNDVVLAMCAGAMRAYLRELDALPETPMVAMVPVGLNAKKSHIASGDGGNAVGAVMVQLATDRDDAADRLASIHRSMADGKEALSAMTPAQIVAMSALGQAPAMLTPLLRLNGVVRPPYNLIISNVPGPRETLYWNGATLVGYFPLSIPINGMGLNITCLSYDGRLAFGLTGCRRTVPRLQRLLSHLDDEVAALEKAVGV